MNFEPVHTLADLQSLNYEDILEGYKSAEHGDPEPGPNRGRAFWHGWRNWMMDHGEIPIDDGHRQLVREVLQHQLRVGNEEAASASKERGYERHPLTVRQPTGE